MKTRPARLSVRVSHALVPTPIGAIGLAWTERGLLFLQLPERTEKATLARMQKALVKTGASDEAAPPPRVADAIRRITRLLEGHAEDLSSIPVDLDRVPPFFRRVYEASRAVGRGEVRTYAEIAAAAGSPAATRAVGQALAKNPVAIVIPCHRVVASGGRPGGFSAHGGLDTKARLLALEGASLKTRPAAP